MISIVSMDNLLVPRHPFDDCHQAQLECLRQTPADERAHLAQLLRFGNATYCYYHFHEAQVTEADYLEWLDGLPVDGQAKMRALGFDELRDSLPLRRYVLEKNDVGLSDYQRVLLSPTDWLAYQETLATALNPWLPPLT